MQNTASTPHSLLGLMWCLSHCKLGINFGVSAVMSKVLLQEIETIIIMQTLKLVYNHLVRAQWSHAYTEILFVCCSYIKL